MLFLTVDEYLISVVQCSIIVVKILPHHVVLRIC